MAETYMQDKIFERTNFTQTSLTKGEYESCVFKDCNLILSCPFLLVVDKIYNKTQNLKYRYLQEGTLFP